MVFAFKIIGEDVNHQNKKYKKIAFKIYIYIWHKYIYISTVSVRQVDGG